MKARSLLPLFATLVFTATARSESPGQPRPDGSLPGGPMAERLKHRLEELHRDGKHEEAKRLEGKASEMWERRRGNAPGGHRAGPPAGMPPVNPGERAEHLAEAAKHLRAAGIPVSPEQLERMAGKAGERMTPRPPFKPGGGPGAGSGSSPWHRPFQPMSKPAPGGGSPMEAMHDEIRALAKQVQELRAIVQGQRGGPQPSARPEDRSRGGDRRSEPRKHSEHRGDKPHGDGAHADKPHEDKPHEDKPHEDKPHEDKARREEHKDDAPAPGAGNEPRRENPARPEGASRRRTEG